MTALMLNEWLDGGNRCSDTVDLAVSLLLDREATSVYDAGCGNGELIAQLVRRSKAARLQLYASDVEPGHASIAFDRIGQAVADFDSPYRSVVWKVEIEDATRHRPGLGTWFLDAVVALNWLHNDWPSKHATGIPARELDPTYLSRALATFHSILRPGGVLIWDHPRPEAIAEGLHVTMTAMLDVAGFHGQAEEHKGLMPTTAEFVSVFVVEKP